MNKYHNLAKKFRKEVTKDWGKKCEDFDYGCIVCQSHRVVDGLENMGDLFNSLNKDKQKKHEHKP